MKWFWGTRKTVAPPATEASQQVTFTRRAMLLSGAQWTIGGLLAVRMGYISLVENERYSLLSESNRVDLTLMPPRRGWIVDRYGKALADNRVALRVDIIPERMTDKARTLATLRDLLQLNPDQVDRIQKELVEATGFRPVEVANNLDEARFSAVSVRLPELPGVQPSRGFTRNYPSGPAVAHLVGYVGSASAEEYKKKRDPLYITPGFKVGKDGIEKDFQDSLRGTPGARRVEVTARGKIVRDLGSQPDVPGEPLQLTIDADLQDYVARRMGLESGSAVIIDTLTGGVLALVSMPAFDPNSFSDGIGRMEWKMLQDDDHLPLLNKAMRGLYPPGSTVKPMAAVALIEAGVDPTDTVFCGGGYRLGNRYFKCLGHHGSVSMPHAIEKSCNTYFYAMAHRVGYDKVAPIAKAFGLGQQFPIGGTAQRYGTVPDSEWKLRKLKQPWSASDSLNAMIGQGYVSVNPLQLALMTARIASGRNLQPSLLLADANTKAEPLSYSAEALDIARRGMFLVVNGNGTGVRARLPIPNVQLAGKTGTAQVRNLGPGRGGIGVQWKYRDHGLFICYAPVDEPRYAAAIVIEHGMGGARAAAPVAKDVFTYLYDREAGMKSLLALESGWGGTPTERLAKRYASYVAPPPPAPTTVTAPTPGPASGNATQTPKPPPTQASTR